MRKAYHRTRDMNPEIVGSWETLRLLPTTLTRMVVSGQAKIRGRDFRGRRLYVMRYKDLLEARAQRG